MLRPQARFSEKNLCRRGIRERVLTVTTACVVGAIFALSLASNALAQSGRLNDSGQISCFDENDSIVACDNATTGNNGVRPHQDGRYGRDAADATSSLVKVGGGVAGFDFSCVLWNGTVIDGPNCTEGLVANTGSTPSATPATDWACTKDNVTGLVWSLETHPLTPATSIGSAIFASHNSQARCGFSSAWRLPAARELFNIVVFREPAPTIDSLFFPNTVAAEYWVQDVAAQSATSQWIVSFLTGATFPSNQSAPAHVRLVRGAQALPDSIAQPGGIIEDRNTGLFWDRCPLGRSGSLCDVGNASLNDFASALNAVSARNTANHLGFNDWRLPNRNELESLVKRDAFNPAIDTSLFPQAGGIFWTSTTRIFDPGVAVVLDASDGSVGASLKASEVFVRLVRGGRPPASFDALPLINGACGSANATSPLITNAPETNLCSAGTASAVTAGNTAYTWTCDGQSNGSNASCSAARGYTVTPIASVGGTISPTTSQVLPFQSAPVFNAIPNNGFAVFAWIGSCGGVSSGAGNTNFTATPVSSSCTVSAIFSTPAALNIDNSAPDTVYHGPTDGVLLLRYLLGYRGNALIADARGAGANLRDAAAIETYLLNSLPVFDVDGDSGVAPHTDGLMILRRLLNPSAPITDSAAMSAITANAKRGTRTDAEVVTAIDALMQ